MKLEKYGQLCLTMMLIWFLLVAGLGLVISFQNGTFF